MKNVISFTLLFTISFAVFAQNADNYSNLVNPFIGTGAHGHTFPGATSPFGMVQLSPDTRLEGWDGCGGYHHDDDFIYGFSHTHLSGTGVPDYCDILLMPGNGKPVFNNAKNGGYGSKFKHESESASAGFYQVFLEDPKVLAQLTTTTRVGFHKYEWNKPNKPWVMIDLEHRDQVIDAYIEQVSPTEIKGYRFSNAWATHQKVYFYAKFSAPFNLIFENQPTGTSKLVGQKVKAVALFDPSFKGEVEISVGLSFASQEGAYLNWKSETKGINFAKARINNQQLWNAELAKIAIETPKIDQKIKFYTALYHCFIAPNTFSDVDGSYMGMDGKLHQDKNHIQYTVFSLWDTFRALHPLFTIIQQKRTLDFINTFINQFKQSGRLPVWELAANETNCMIGYHAVSVVADAYTKGITDFDTKTMAEAMMTSANSKQFGLPIYIENKYLPADSAAESVSKTLEYAYNDWCIATYLRSIGLMLEADRYLERSKNWSNLFNFSNGFFQAKINNAFVSNFDPFEVNNYYTEANAWQYSTFVPHDLTNYQFFLGLGPGLTLENHLDRMFKATPKTTGRQQSDITGLIGQYAHGNEPSHHVPWLYMHTPSPKKGMDIIDYICDSLYTNAPDGLCGNEDCGQMSAWYVLASLGMYQICPGKPIYTLSYPQVQKATIFLENNNSIVILADTISNTDQPLFKVSGSQSYLALRELRHEMILNGGTIDFRKSDNGIPSVNFIGFASPTWPLPTWEKAPKTFSKPFYLKPQRSLFHKELYFYAYKNMESSAYQADSFYVDTTMKVGLMYVDKDGNRYPMVYSHFLKIPANRHAVYTFPYANQYSASGETTLVDQVMGTTEWNMGNWQGFEGVNLEVLIDFNTLQTPKKVGLNCLQDENAWIFLPKSVSYYASENGKEYVKLGTVKNPYTWQQKPAFTYTFDLKNNQKFRYLKVVAETLGKCPVGHKGEGEKAWIFADELILE